LEIALNKRSDTDDYVLQVIMTILHIMRNLQHSGMDVLSDVELSYPQILVVYALLEMGTSTMGGLSKRLRTSQGVVSRTVDRLVEKGMVDRRRDEEDRRVVFVTLSAEGMRFATRMISYHSEKLTTQLEQVPADDRERFLEFLKQIDDQFGEQSG
jgi:DNA-binding MarR family transcriptional regulator